MLARLAIAAVVLAACDPIPPPKPPTPTTPWEVPAGWKSETIAFPLEFAPNLAHTGVEELRFAPGFFDPSAPGYWSYAFVWRLDDEAKLDGAALGAEITAYFRGLIAAVDGDKKRITDRDAIVATATPEGTGFRVAAHVFDAFKTAQPLDLAGTAERVACPSGHALWVFVLAPASTGVRPQLEQLAKAAVCGQPALPKK